MPTQEAAGDVQVAGGSSADSRRERSTISFPYLDLTDAIAVAKGVHAAGGKSCQQEQLAAGLGIEMNSSTFRVKLNTARIFGLITYTTDVVYLTEVGLHACDDKQEAAAKVDAFLAVPLYKKVYQEYRGTQLPPLPALENAFIGFGVAAKQAANARQTFYRSAKQAGFLDADPKRLVLPTVKGRANTLDGGESSARGNSDADEAATKNNGGGGDGGGGATKNPLLRGLIEQLPEPDSAWPVEKRKKWLNLAVHIFDSVYTGAENDAVAITVSTEKGSVN